MLDEEFFQAALDAKIDDSGVRLQFAVWLEERGDWRVAGYRYMAEQHKHPYRSYATWEWWQAESANPQEIILPDRLWTELPVRPPTGYPRCKEWPSRRAAEEALCTLVAPARPAPLHDGRQPRRVRREPTKRRLRKDTSS